MLLAGTLCQLAGCGGSTAGWWSWGSSILLVHTTVSSRTKYLIELGSCPKTAWGARGVEQHFKSLEIALFGRAKKGESFNQARNLSRVVIVYAFYENAIKQTCYAHQQLRQVDKYNGNYDRDMWKSDFSILSTYILSYELIFQPLQWRSIVMV